MIRSGLAAQLGLKVKLERLVYGCHLEAVGQSIALNVDPPRHRRDADGCRAQNHGSRLEVKGRARKMSDVDLGDSRRLSDDQLDAVGTAWADVSVFGVQRGAGRGPGLLVVGQERFSDMIEGDFLAVLERLDGRIIPASFATPVSQQERQ